MAGSTASIKNCCNCFKYSSTRAWCCFWAVPGDAILTKSPHSPQSSSLPLSLAAAFFELLEAFFELLDADRAILDFPGKLAVWWRFHMRWGQSGWVIYTTFHRCSTSGHSLACVHRCPEASAMHGECCCHCLQYWMANWGLHVQGEQYRTIERIRSSKPSIFMMPEAISQPVLHNDSAEGKKPQNGQQVSCPTRQRLFK